MLTTSNMEDIKIFISAGDLLQDLPRTRGELSKFQEKDLLQLVETKFHSITGLHCDPRKFRNNVRKYVDKIKKNRRRWNDNILSDWFNDFVVVSFESDTDSVLEERFSLGASSSSSLPLPSLQLPSSLPLPSLPH